MIKTYFIDYEQYVVFTKNDKVYTRRVYKESTGKYYYRFKNEKVTINENELYY